jgi:hypothetical protein
MGNTGEGKTIVACSLIQAQKNVIIINTKHDPVFAEGDRRIGLLPSVDSVVTRDNQIFHVQGGRYDYRPSDDFLRNPEAKDRFFAWALAAGNRVIYIDEFNDICPSAQVYPYYFQKAIKQGRWKGLGIWGSAQEPIRVPSFCFGQSQYRILFYLGWQPHRKTAEEWFQSDIDWSLIPERSHKFLVKTTSGVFGPQGKLNFRKVKIASQSKS